MSELEELIEFAKTQLDTAQQNNDKENTYFYQKVLKICQGETGPFWGRILKSMKEKDEQIHSSE